MGARASAHRRYCDLLYLPYAQKEALIARAVHIMTLRSLARKLWQTITGSVPDEPRHESPRVLPKETRQYEQLPSSTSTPSPASTNPPRESRIVWPETSTSERHTGADSASRSNTTLTDIPARKAAPSTPPAKAITVAGSAITPRIDWGGANSGGILADLSRLIGVEDAYEHTPLRQGEQVAVCTHDQVAYHLETWQFLQQFNNGKCCSCGRAGTIKIVALPGAVPIGTAVNAASRSAVQRSAISWLDADQKTIGNGDIANHIGLAVVVQDYVYKVHKTKSKGTYFVRFEPHIPPAPIFTGFKVVIFSNYEQEWLAVGQNPMLYQGHTVRVRGVVQRHYKYGLEILVNSPRVIQIVK
jgi:hypothetical protein